MKNNVQECVLLSPEEYFALVDAANDAKLYALASERISNMGQSRLISEKEHKKKYGITDQQLKGFEEVEFE